jgi:hypothetical protein
LLNASGRVFVIWYGKRGVLKLETRTGRCEARWGRAHVLFFYLDLRPKSLLRSQNYVWIARLAYCIRVGAFQEVMWSKDESLK